MSQTSNDSEFTHLEEIARSIRIDILNAIYAVGTGHPGSSLSAVEVLTMLYFGILQHDPSNPGWEDRDRFIMSKGHGAPAYYATLARSGYFETNELFTLRQLGGRLHGHPKAHVLPGVDVSTGSLGQGLSIGLGLALGFRQQNRLNRVFCLLGDGELQEGQNWEAFMASSAYRVDNLIAIIDRNRLQNDKETEKIIALEDLVDKFHSFGWRAIRVNGHDFPELKRAFNFALTREGRPNVIIAETVKGKGVSFMENVVKWHHHPINKEEMIQALSELEARNLKD